MSLRYEQYASLKHTKELLYDLMFTQTRPKTVKELKRRAGRCLHHFPPLRSSGMPIFSKDDFTDNEGDMK